MAEEEKSKSSEDAGSLESKDSGNASGAQSSEGASLDGGSNPETNPGAAVVVAKKKGAGQKVRGLISHLNIYFLIFVFIVVLAAGIILIGMQRSKKAQAPVTIATQPLTQDALNKLKDSETKVGDPKQTLTIESNSIFSGKVLIRDSLDVAGGIKVGSSLSLPGLSVSGSSTFDQLQANKLTVSGDTNIQGQLNVLRGITTSGGGSFGGPLSATTITAQSIQLTGDFQVTRHIDAGGPTPGKSDGTALGSGGTSSVSGTDTAGTITANIGGSPSIGCFVTITFTQKFSGTPHIAIAPIGSAAAGLNYYLNRSSSSFSLCSTNAAPAGQTFSFDYIVVD